MCIFGHEMQGKFALLTLGDDLHHYQMHRASDYNIYASIYINLEYGKDAWRLKNCETERMRKMNRVMKVSIEILYL
jgi:hypothetical protein